MAALQKIAGIDITQISYRDFSPAFQDFATGRVQLLATGITLLLPQVQSGRGRFLMVTNSARSPLAPDVPTPQEAGFPELTFNGVNGIYGWRDMPESVKARIAADVREIAADPAVAERLQADRRDDPPGQRRRIRRRDRRAARQGRRRRAGGRSETEIVGWFR